MDHPGKALMEFAPLLESVFNSAPVPNYLLSPTAEAVILAVNDAFLKVSSRRREDLVGSSLWAAFPANPDDPTDLGETVLRKSLARVIATGLPDALPAQRYPIRVVTADGEERYEERYWNAVNTPIFDADGQLACISHTTFDVTKQVQAESALRRSEVQYRELFDSLTEGFCVIDILFDADGRAADFRFRQANPAFERQSGLHNVVGRTMRELSPQLEMSWFDHYGRVVETGEPARFESEAKPLGRCFDVHAFRTGEPGAYQVAVLFRDITEQKAAEKRWRHQKASLQLALRVGRSGTFEWDARTHEHYWSDEILLLYGLKREASARTVEEWLACVLPEDREATMAAVERSLGTGEFSADFRIRRRDDGEIRWISARGQVFADNDGSPQRMLGINVDVTEQRQLLSALDTSKARLEAILDSLNEGVVIFDLDGRVLDTNPAALELMDCATASEAHVSLPEFVPTFEVLTRDGRVLPLEEWPIGRVVRGDAFTDYELLVRRTDLGSERVLSHNGALVRDKDGRAILGVLTMMDVTERTHAEEQMRISEEKYRTLFANMTEGFALGEPILDAQGLPADIRYLEVNEAFYRQSGLPRDILGRPQREYLPGAEQLWIDRFTAVALTGRGERIDSYSAPTRRHFDVNVFCPSPGRFAILFRDVTQQKRVHEALLDSEQRYKALFNNKTMGVAHQRIVTDAAGQPVDYVYEAMNDVCLRMIGMRREDVIGRRATEVFPGIGDFEFDFIGVFGRIGLQGGEGEFEYYFPPIKQWVGLYAYSPKHGECTVIFTEATARRAAEAALQRSEQRLALALKGTGTAVWEMDVATLEVIPATELAFTMLGYAAGDFRSLHEWMSLMHEEDLPDVREMIDAVIAGWRDSYSRELRLRARDGRWHWVLSQATAAQRESSGKAVRLVGTHTDINERKLAEERARAAALHDPLTGLPNRALLFEYGGHLVAAAHRNHSYGALLFIDLDRFKPINDIYGHETGDRVLQEVSKRLIGCTRQEDVVGRLGGDEFVIVLPHLDAGRHRAAAVAQHVIDSISQPYPIEGLELSISPSIGISYYPEHATNVSTLLHTADLAMYQAKQAGRANYQFYAPELERQTGEIYSLEARLRDALKHGGLTLHYQPVVDIRSGRLIGAEALARLSASDGSLICPARFIPVAESAGLIQELGEWVAAEACRQHAAWLSQGLRVAIAINVSPLQFRQRDFAQRLGEIVAESGVAANGLQIEVTESTVMENVHEAIEILKQLKAVGVKVALDDFGTGHSSLSSLSSLPLDKLKVDQAFMRNVSSDPTSRAITKAMIALGRALNLEVVGEGIESEETYGYLRSEGCDQAQGFWVSHPLPPYEFAQWYREQRLH